MTRAIEAIERIEFGARQPNSIAEAILRATPVLFEAAEQRATVVASQVTNGSLAVSSSGEFYGIHSGSIETQDGTTLMCAEETAVTMARRRNLHIVSFHITAPDHVCAVPCMRCRHSSEVMGGGHVIDDVTIVTRQRDTFSHQVRDVLQLDAIGFGGTNMPEQPTYIVDDNYERLMTGALALCNELVGSSAAKVLDMPTPTVVEMSWSSACA